MNIIKSKSCCFTGHRPERLNYSEHEIKILLQKAIDTAISDGYTTFITGMARGTDIWAAEIVLDRKKHFPDLQLICAVPHPNFEKKRSVYETARYNNIILKSDCTVTVSSFYYKGCYQVRNKFMVDNSSLVIAVFNGQASGTKNTILYAKSKNLKITNVLNI